ncbi:hypothetical protein LEP1GSC072_0945 [Leptospira noguchii str. Bonito]|nr:hypothetical protein LEP1GSC072_0945 [Leptospira noguchii str. Bonito]
MLLTMDRSIIIAFAFVMPNSRYLPKISNKAGLLKELP